MAVPGGSNFDDVLRQAEGLADDIGKARKAVQAATTEAQRSGTSLRIPRSPVPTATDPATEARRRLADAEDRARRLEAEYAEAQRIQKRLTDAQRNLLSRIAKAQGETEALPTTRGLDLTGRDRRTFEALQRRGLVAASATNVDTGLASRAIATSAGLGAHDPRLVQGDIINQGKFVEQLRNEVQKLGRASEVAGGQVRRATGDLNQFPQRVLNPRPRQGVDGPDFRSQAEVDADRERIQLQRELARIQRAAPVSQGLRGFGGQLNTPGLEPAAVQALRDAIQARGAVVQQPAVTNSRRLTDEARAQAKLERDLTTLRSRSVSILTQARIQAEGIGAATLTARAALAQETGLTVRRGTIDPATLAARVAAAQPPPPPPPPAPPQPPFVDPRVTEPQSPRFIGTSAVPNVRDVEQVAQSLERVKRGEISAAEATRQFNREFNQASTILATSDARLRQNRIEVARSSAEYGALSNEMRKHGAATTEFLTALAQGRTTIGEIGFQAAATAGKFAAWTAASVGVYGALTTVAAVGRGAIDSMSGVNELSRFINDLDTDRAQQQFRALSREFNLPIATVTEAFAGMGRTFQNQDQAFEATRQTLLAMRVGELEVADSTRFLSAIVQGFGLTAQDLPQIINQINQAQNQFNFQIRDGVAGISRAAGTWKAAAADGEDATETFSTLLAVMTTAQRSTGATGEVVGTALRRSAEFIGRENNRVQLRGFGIDPDQGISAIFRQAFAQVQSGQVQGQDVTRLATALSSPQLASIIGPTLQNFQLFNRVLKETNAEASRGSAQRELSIQLSSIREQAARVATSLEQIGSALADIGALDAFGALLATINLALTAADSFLDTLSALPDPLTKTLITAGEIYAVFRLLRRLNIGESLTAAVGRSEGVQRTFRRPFGTFTQRSETLGQGLTNDPTRQTFRTLVADQDNSLKALRRDQEAYGSSLRRAARDVESATLATRRLAQGPGPDLRGLSSVQAQEAQRIHFEDIRRASAEADGLTRIYERQRVELEAINAEITHMEDRLGRAKQAGRRDPAAGVRVFTQDPEFPVHHTVATFDRPAGQLSTRVFDDIDAAALGLPPVVQQSVQQKAALIVEESTEAVAQAAQTGAVAGTRDATSTVRGRASRVGATAVSAGRSMAASIRGFGSAMLGFFGPIEIAFLGIAFLPDIINHFQRRAEERRAQVERFKAPVIDEQTFRTRLEDAQKAFDAQEEEVQKRQEALDQTRPESSARSAQQAALQRVDDSGQPIAPSSVAQAQVQFVRDAQNRATEQLRARQEGRVVPLRFTSEIASSLETDIASIVRGDDDARSALVVFNRYHEAIATSMEASVGSAANVRKTGEALQRAKERGADPAEIEKLQQDFDLATQAQQRVVQAFGALNLRFATLFSPQQAAEAFNGQRLAEVATSLQQQAGLIEQFGPRRARLITAATAYSVAAQKWASSANPEAYLQAIDAAQQAFEGAINTLTQRTVDRIKSARTPRQARQIATGALDTLQSEQAELIRQSEQAEREAAAAEERRQRARRRLNASVRPGFRTPLGQAGTDIIGGATSGFGLNQTQAQLRAAYQQAVEDANAAAGRARGAKKAVADGERALAAASQNIINALLTGTDREAANLRLATARAGTDGAAAARAARASAQRNVSAIRSAMKGTSGALRTILKTMLINSMAAVVEAGNDVQAAAEQAEQEAQQRVTEQISRMQQQSTIRQLRAPESARGGIALGDLKKTIAFAKANGADQDAINDLTIQYLQQEESNAQDAKSRAEEAKAKAEEVIQKKREAIQAIFEFRRSKTDDPNTLARLDEEEARAIAAIPGQDRNDRLTNRADINNKVRDREQKRVDEKLHQLDLEHDIGRLTDAAYLRGLRQLESTLKKGTQARRSIHEQILRFKHDAESESSLDLDIGNIRLPTAYEIRRLRQQGTNPAMNVQQSNTYNITVDSNEQAEIIGSHLEGSRGAFVSKMRNAGLRGG